MGDVREALRLVAQTLVPGHGPGTGGLAEVTNRHGLPRFDAVAVADHGEGFPDVVAASCSSVRAALDLEVVERQGPATACGHTGEVVVCRDLAADRRWLELHRAGASGLVPLRRWVVVPLGPPGERPLGSLVLAAEEPGIVTPDELATIGALADQACLAVTAHVGAGREARAVLAMDDVREVAIAVGRLMELRGLSEAEALAWLKGEAHDSGDRLADVARHLDRDHVR